MERVIGITGERGELGSQLLELYMQGEYEIIPFNTNTKRKVDRVIHLAARLPFHAPEELISSNIIYLNQILEHSKNIGVKEIIFFSSVSVYGSVSSDDLTETDEIVNPDLYGFSKLYGEKILEQYDLKSLVLRIPGLLETRKATNFLSKTYDALKKNKTVSVTECGRMFNNFISADDIYKFISNVKLITSHDVINLAAEKEMTITDVIKEIKSTLGSESKITYKKGNNCRSVSIEKAKNIYRYEPIKVKDILSSWCEVRNSMAL